MTVGPRKKASGRQSTSVGSEAGNLGRWKHYKLNPGWMLTLASPQVNFESCLRDSGRDWGSTTLLRRQTRPRTPACPLIATYGKHRRQAIDTACCRSHITRASTQHDGLRQRLMSHHLLSCATGDVLLGSQVALLARSSLQLQLPSSPAINNTLARQSGMPPERVYIARASPPLLGSHLEHD